MKGTDKEKRKTILYKTIGLRTGYKHELGRLKRRKGKNEI